MQLRAIVTEGTKADCSYAKDFIENFEAKTQIADCGCDADDILESAEGKGVEAVIPLKNRNNLDNVIINLHIKTSGRNCLSAFKVLERDCIKICYSNLS